MSFSVDLPGNPPPVDPTVPTGSVPSPPGGHALWIDPRQHREPVPAPTIAVVDEVSAGGLVIRVVQGRLEAAIIARRNRAGRLEWCLPKGHLEGTETPEEAAVREIAEETGIMGTIRRRLGIIDYWFSGEERRVHKVVHHFLLAATGGYLTVEGDPDGEAEDAAWVDVEELPHRLSYPNERRLTLLAKEVLSHDSVRSAQVMAGRVQEETAPGQTRAPASAPWSSTDPS